jgi:hypothetical protein
MDEKTRNEIVGSIVATVAALDEDSLLKLEIYADKLFDSLAGGWTPIGEGAFSSCCCELGCGGGEECTDSLEEVG